MKESLIFETELLRAEKFRLEQQVNILKLELEQKNVLIEAQEQEILKGSNENVGRIAVNPCILFLAPRNR